MGTTLAHGIYLPSEGERNCYAGLKVNWETLDQKVADISALQSAIAGALHREIVVSLPTTDIDTATIYMILNGTSATENIYDEYMYISNAWELIGTSATDLTNYYTKGEVDSKLLLKANASDLTSHTGDTTIHVTASDKAKWDTLALIKHLRLVNAQVGSATTIPFSDFDDTNGIKVGDKCADLDVKVFEITAVDTANQTVTVTPLLDIALDANVVHTSGNETIGGAKTFPDKLTMLNAVRGLDLTSQTVDANDLTSNASGDIKLYRCTSISGAVNITNIPVQTAFVLIVMQIKYTGVADSRTIQIFYDVASSSVVNVYTRIQYNGTWSNWRKDTDKFVTTDTNQTVGGEKTFNDLQIIGYGTQYKGARNAYILPEFSAGYSGLSITTLSFAQTVKIGNFVLDANNKPTLDTSKAYVQIATGENNNVNSCIIEPRNGTDSSLGTSVNKWKQINGLTPSSLSLPASSATVDISGYIADLTGVNVNNYTPVANGYIVITCNSSDVEYIKMSNNLDFVSVVDNTNNQFTSGLLGVWQPCIAGIGVQVRIKSNALNSARFIPCQGNV